MNSEELNFPIKRNVFKSIKTKKEIMTIGTRQKSVNEK